MHTLQEGAMTPYSTESQTQIINNLLFNLPYFAFLQYLQGM